MSIGSTLVLSPLLPWPLLGGLLAMAALAAGWGFYRRARGAGWRAAALAALCLGLVNPALIAERRQAVKDVAVIVLDQSPSQALGSRAPRAQQALTGLEER
ncbi:MAG: hypothetical protein WCJ64_07965, partial [Rhodospirillaceae bacterium]